jgi:nitrogen fixation protein NifZ
MTPTPQTLPGLDARQAKYREGEFVLAATELYNDGSHPDGPQDQLLAVPGCIGEIVQVGHHEEANLPVYMVDFGHAVIGCLEEEIVPEGTDLATLAPLAEEA